MIYNVLIIVCLLAAVNTALAGDAEAVREWLILAGIGILVKGST